MADRAGGVLVESVEEAADAIVKLLRRGGPRTWAQRGARVQEHFLMPRLLLNEAVLIAQLRAKRPLIPHTGSRIAS